MTIQYKILNVPKNIDSPICIIQSLKTLNNYRILSMNHCTRVDIVVFKKSGSIQLNLKNGDCGITTSFELTKTELKNINDEDKLINHIYY